MNRPSSDARNRIAAATSDGSANRPPGPALRRAPKPSGCGNLHDLAPWQINYGDSVAPAGVGGRVLTPGQLQLFQSQRMNDSDSNLLIFSGTSKQASTNARKKPVVSIRNSIMGGTRMSALPRLLASRASLLP